jgi:rubrerythrin
MADEEVKHANWFADLKLNFETKSANPFMEKMSREIFDDLLGEKNFSLQDVDFSSVENADDLIEIFIEFEQDSVLFYQILEPFIEDPVVLDNLKTIIEEENRHIKHLREFIESEEMFATRTEQ